MIRATNTGATAIIDHEARVQAELAPQTRGILEGRVQGRVGLTPYTLWVSKWGLYPLWGLGGLALALSAIGRRRHP